MRNLSNASKEEIEKLRTLLIEGINSLLSFYNNLYNEIELELLKKALILLQKINPYNKKETEEIINNLEKKLKNLFFRTWEKEYQSGESFISWFKNDKVESMPKVISATFGNSETFCNSRFGISYEVSLDGFLGALYKDAATVIEPINRNSIYTIGIIDGKVINTYNLTTPLVTPKMIVDEKDNNYPSKHNEVILDSRYVKLLKVIYTNENDLDMVNLISKKYQIPIEFQSKRKK